ncbi:hypothetical protein [Cyclobacterium plantarum]|uniref:hypothetical protein n=1 Tax=Cyclobacterium plantarum TaxID=2716263 RepID=UPI003F70DFB5
MGFEERMLRTNRYCRGVMGKVKIGELPLNDVTCRQRKPPKRSNQNGLVGRGWGSIDCDSPVKRMALTLSVIQTEPGKSSEKACSNTSWQSPG